MNNVWNFRTSAADGTQFSYPVVRLGQTVQTLVASAAFGVVSYGGVRLVQRWGYLQQHGVLTLRNAVLFFVVSAAIQEAGALLLEAAQAVLGERRRFENLEFNAQTTTGDKLRKYSWKVISAFEYLPHQIDRLFSSVFGIRTMRAMETAANIPARDIRYMEILRRSLLEQVVEFSVMYVTQESALYTGERLGYDTRLIRYLVASEYKLMFIGGLLLKIMLYVTEKFSDQAMYDRSLQINAGRVCLNGLRNSLAPEVLERVPYVLGKSASDLAIKEQLLTTVIREYSTGTLRAASLPIFLTVPTVRYIEELRANGSVNIVADRVAELIATNTLLFEDCVEEVFGHERGVTLTQEAVASTADHQQLLQERDRGALTLLLAQFIKTYGIDSQELPLPVFLPEDALKMIASVRAANEDDKTIFSGKYQNLRDAVLQRVDQYPEQVQEFIGVLNGMIPDRSRFIAAVEEAIPLSEADRLARELANLPTPILTTSLESVDPNGENS